MVPLWPVPGSDVLLLVGLLVLARFAVTLSAWDTANGFALMGASRELTFSVFIEPLLLLTMLVAAISAGGTDLAMLSGATAGGERWTHAPAWLAAAAFVLVMLAETGRQPFDNPDTHLELTMVHEGPLLEYAGRDLALLHWVAAARHWIVIGLAATIFLPHATSGPERGGAIGLAFVGSCLAMAIAESMQAKMRILLVPRVLAAGAGLALLAIATTVTGAGA
jgi:formate hydrogenlyase subunit 4